jgi:carbamate kinase
MTVEAQRHNVRIAATALAPVARQHQLVLSHGNGPQIGLLALQAAAYTPVKPYPLDVLGAQTQGMIGYLLEQELGNLLPMDVPFASILTMIEVDAHDPSFQDPTKFIGPVYEEDEAKRIALDTHWTFKQDGSKWRRVVASPRPQRIFELRPIRWLLEHGVIVICAGGGGIPTVYDPDRDRQLLGVEVVIDKDFAGAMLARDVEADMYVMATDAEGVYLDWGTPSARCLGHTTPAELGRYTFPAGSMGPKVAAACEFVVSTGHRAAIGSLADIERIVAGEAGTLIEPD